MYDKLTKFREVANVYRMVVQDESVGVLMLWLAEGGGEWLVDGRLSMSAMRKEGEGF